MQIGNKNLHDLKRPLLIAEAGSSHGGDPKIALKMVKVAIDAGADAVTFQEIYEEKLYTSLEELPVSKQPRIGWECLKECGELARSNGLLFSVCVTDLESLEKAISVPIDFIKIVSYDITFKPFLQECGKKNLPILMSTGASTEEEIQDAIDSINVEDNLLLYHTDCGYPTKDEEINLKRMLKLREKFKRPVGYCDHTDSQRSCIAAAILGAEAIEKHIILDRSSKFVDYEVALEPDEISNLFKNIKENIKILGDGKFEVPEGDLFRRNNLRRSIALKHDLEKDAVLTEENLTMLRPPIGIAWEERESIIGKRVKRDLKKRQIITLDLLK